METTNSYQEMSVNDVLKIKGKEICVELVNDSGYMFLFSVTKKHFKQEMQRQCIDVVIAEIKSSLIFIKL